MPPDVWGDIIGERVSDNDRDTVVLCRSAGSRGRAAGARRLVGNAALGAPDRRGLSQCAPDRAVRHRLAQALRRTHADGASAPYQRLPPHRRGRLRDRDGERRPTPGRSRRPGSAAVCRPAPVLQGYGAGHGVRSEPHSPGSDRRRVDRGLRRRRARRHGWSAASSNRPSCSRRCSVRCRKCWSSMPARGTVGGRLASTVGEIAHLVEAATPGTQAMLGRMMELLFVEVLRRHASRLPAGSKGLLAALNDPLVGRALQLLHADPARRWTADTLAREAGSSRTVLGERFNGLLGRPPIDYLTSWRMQVAADRLRHGRDGIAQNRRRYRLRIRARFRPRLQARDRHDARPLARRRRRQPRAHAAAVQGADSGRLTLPYLL